MQLLLQTQDNLERHQQLFGGLIAILRVATIQDIDDLLRFIRTKADMSQVAAHVRNALRMNPYAQEVFNSIDFVIDDSLGLPSPSQLLSEQPAMDPALIKRNARLDR